LIIGQTISHYKILEKLGDGGMGVVYKAEDTKLHRTVALKFLPPELTSDPEAKERLLREAQAASSLQHHNICTIHEIGQTDDGQMFICMDYYEGETLKEKLSDARAQDSLSMPVLQILNYSIQIAQGLAKAHEKGIIHRDIKPANIMLTNDGVVKILDFGLARLFGKSKSTQTGKAIGTIVYLSPEQAEGKNVDFRTDIWSLGVVLYEMCTLKLPFEHDYDAAVIYAILDKDPPIPSQTGSHVPEIMDHVILMCLQKKPADRYQSAEELLSDLIDIKKRFSGKELQSSTEERKTIRLKKIIKNKWIYSLVVAFLILIVGGIFLLPQLNQKHKSIESIAVLPLENLSNDKEQEYFVSGIHEELLTDLSKIKALRVISRTSMMQYEKTKKSASEIAKELNVDALVEGSVMRVNNHVRINVQLIDGATDKHLWAENYDRDVQDVLTMLSEVAQAITQEIAITVTQQEKDQLTIPHPINLEVHEEYFKGRYAFHQLTYQGYQDALMHFRKAIEIDPHFAAGYAGQASVYFILGFFGMKPFPEVIPESRALALKALEMDDALAEAHSVMGWIKLCYDWDWSGAAKELQRALNMNPNDALARHAYGDYLTVMGHIEEGIHQIALAREYDPLAPIAVVPPIFHLQFVHRYDEIIEECKKLLSMNPNYPSARDLLRDALWFKGNYKEALVEYHNTWGRDEKLRDALNRGYKENGPRGALRELAKTLSMYPRPQTGFSLTIATLYALANEKDLAFEWLDKAYNEHAPFLVHLKASPSFDSLHSDPRFHSLLQRIGFPETEKEHLNE
jgi:eukaryotic-like serine/threonine-protein kinase